MEINVLLALIGYGFCYFLWKNGYRAYSIMLSFIATLLLYYLVPQEYHIVVWALMWINVFVIIVKRDEIYRRFMGVKG